MLAGLSDWGNIDWGEIISTGIKSTPTIITAIKGQSYASGPQGTQGGGGYGGGGGSVLQSSGGIPGLGGGSFNLSSNTLLLLVGAVVAIFALRR